jgi:hypothetical protein
MIFMTRARFRQQHQVVAGYHEQYYPQFDNGVHQQVVGGNNGQYYPQYGNGVYLNGQFGQVPYGASPYVNQMNLSGGPLPYTVAEATVIGAANGDGAMPVATVEAVVGDAYPLCQPNIIQVLPENGPQIIDFSTGTNNTGTDSINSNPTGSYSQVPQSQAEPVRPTFFRF